MLDHSANISSFDTRIEKVGLSLCRLPLEILQVNLGKYCNQSCSHCHVGAGPKQVEENMDRPTAKRIIELVKGSPQIKTLDLTGGAPELNLNFRFIIEALSSDDIQIINRSNLTVLLEKGQEDTIEFLTKHKVKIIASLPCYSEENVDRQRGRGIFLKSLEALRLLNQSGYGQSGTGLYLDLVYNPGGSFLPPSQVDLKREYQKQLFDDFGIVFNDLLCLTNMPIKRFKHWLVHRGEYFQYMKLLESNFNEMTAERLMCRRLISVAWDGKIYDCDFNQTLEVPIGGKVTSVWDIESFEAFNEGKIACDKHCFGCTAGSGSSCGGSLLE